MHAFEWKEERKEKNAEQERKKGGRTFSCKTLPWTVAGGIPHG